MYDAEEYQHLVSNTRQAKIKTTVLDILKSLYKGDVIEFDLTNDLTKFVCGNNKDHTVSNVTKFTRTTKCVRDANGKLFIN